MNFIPDYTQIEAVLHNQRPKRLPLYEHHIDKPFVEKAIGKKLDLQGNAPRDFENLYSEQVYFWKDMTYDAFSYEAAICEIYPGHGAILGGMPGPIQTRDDFNKYGLGSGNSIADYVPVEGFMAMIDAVKTIRKNENE